MSVDIAGFLLARYDEEEEIARAAINRKYDWETAVGYFVDPDHVDDELLAARDHALRHDPARVLADVAAKRAIVAHYRQCVAEQVLGEGYVVLAVAVVVHHLSAPFATHPDFRAGWLLR